MATGYTEIIERKDDLTFEEFAWRCARAFGAFVMMRDDGLDADIPTSVDNDDYYEKSFRRAQQELEETKRMTLEQAAVEAEKLYQSCLKSHLESKARCSKLEAKYNRMLAKVEAWVPPSADHVEMKKFMLEQIRSSIEHDCHALEAPERQTPEEFLKEAIESAEWDVSYYGKHAEEQRENIRKNNEWIDGLVKSLGKPPKFR